MLRAYLELVRPANVATALADVLAGYAVSGGANPGALPWLLVATACLYAGGVALNDVCDRAIDRTERPERPVPSGRLSVSRAAAASVALLGLGIGAAAFATRDAIVIALLIAALVVLYDAWGKRQRWFGPVNMGACRGLNLLLGVAATPGAVATRWPLALIAWTYIAGVTVLSRGEVSGGSRRVATGALALVGGALAALVTLAIVGAARPGAMWWPLALAGGLAWRTLPPFWKARRTGAPDAIRRAVRAGVLSLVLVDAVIAAVYADMIYSLAVLGTAVLAGWLARVFAVT